MAYVCVICSIKEPPLMALSVALRRLLEAIVAPVINTEVEHSRRFFLFARIEQLGWGSTSALQDTVVKWHSGVVFLCGSKDASALLWGALGVHHRDQRDRSNRIRKKPQRTPCPVCDKIMNVSTLRDHVNRFECDTCKRRFLNKERLKSHIVVVHLRKKEHKCGQCDSAFYRRDKLREHVEVTHENRAKLRKHVCDLCGKSFAIKKTLREHLLSHQGLRPHQCKLCPSTFTYSAALYTHNKLKHLKIKGKWKKKKAPEGTKTNVD